MKLWLAYLQSNAVRNVVQGDIPFSLLTGEAKHLGGTNEYGYLLNQYGATRCYPVFIHLQKQKALKKKVCIIKNQLYGCWSDHQLQVMQIDKKKKKKIETSQKKTFSSPYFEG